MEIFQRCELRRLGEKLNFVEGTTMRFFIGACLFCMTIASLGCMTNNWSSPLFTRAQEVTASAENSEKRVGFFHQTFGMQSGFDARAREIEKDLGFDK